MSVCENQDSCTSSTFFPLSFFLPSSNFWGDLFFFVSWLSVAGATSDEGEKKLSSSLSIYSFS